jgi:hypothetical protein
VFSSGEVESFSVLLYRLACLDGFSGAIGLALKLYLHATQILVAKAGILGNDSEKSCSLCIGVLNCIHLFCITSAAPRLPKSGF